MPPRRPERLAVERLAVVLTHDQTKSVVPSVSSAEAWWVSHTSLEYASAAVGALLLLLCLLRASVGMWPLRLLLLLLLRLLCKCCPCCARCSPKAEEAQGLLGAQGGRSDDLEHGGYGKSVASDVASRSPQRGLPPRSPLTEAERAGATALEATEKKDVKKDVPQKAAAEKAALEKAAPTAAGTAAAGTAAAGTVEAGTAAAGTAEAGTAAAETAPKSPAEVQAEGLRAVADATSRVRAIFDMMNTDGSGSIDRKELGTALKADGELEALLGQAESKGFREVVALVRKLEETGRLPGPTSDGTSKITFIEYERAVSNEAKAELMLMVERNGVKAEMMTEKALPTPVPKARQPPRQTPCSAAGPSAAPRAAGVTPSRNTRAAGRPAAAPSDAPSAAAPLQAFEARKRPLRPMPLIERMPNLDKLEREEDDLVEERNVHTVARAHDLPVDALKTLLSQIKTRMAQSLDRSIDLFRKIDTDGNGFIDATEWRAAVHTLGVPAAPSSTVDAIFAVLDTDGSGQIDYRELHSRIRRTTLDPSVQQPTGTAARDSSLSAQSPRTVPQLAELVAGGGGPGVGAASGRRVTPLSTPAAAGRGGRGSGGRGGAPRAGGVQVLV